MTYYSMLYCLLLSLLISNAALAAPAMTKQCQHCHTEGKASTKRSAALTTLSKTDFIKKLQAYQQQVIPDSIMGKSAHHLNAEQITELADYYSTLKN